MSDAAMPERVKLPYAGLIIDGQEVGDRVPVDVYIEPPSQFALDFSVVVKADFSIEVGRVGYCEVAFFAEAKGGEPVIKIKVGGGDAVVTNTVTILSGDGYLRMT